MFTVEVANSNCFVISSNGISSSPSRSNNQTTQKTPADIKQEKSDTEMFH
jgi:hypothetical protein